MLTCLDLLAFEPFTEARIKFQIVEENFDNQTVNLVPKKGSQKVSKNFLGRGGTIEKSSTLAISKSADKNMCSDERA